MSRVVGVVVASPEWLKGDDGRRREGSSYHYWTSDGHRRSKQHLTFELGLRERLSGTGLVEGIASLVSSSACV